jgi:hypothetical protein
MKHFQEFHCLSSMSNSCFFLRHSILRWLSVASNTLDSVAVRHRTQHGIEVFYKSCPSFEHSDQYDVFTYQITSERTACLPYDVAYPNFQSLGSRPHATQHKPHRVWLNSVSQRAMYKSAPGRNKETKLLHGPMQFLHETSKTN